MMSVLSYGTFTVSKTRNLLSVDDTPRWKRFQRVFHDLPLEHAVRRIFAVRRFGSFAATVKLHRGSVV
jgi:hypothetical protein